MASTSFSHLPGTSINSDQSKSKSKEELRFEKLQLRIKSLETKLEKDAQKYEATLQDYSKKIFPLTPQVLETKEKFLLSLDATSYNFKLSKKDVSILSKIIIGEIRDLMQQTELTPSLEELYNKWSKTTYKEDIEDEKAFEKAMMEASIHAMFDGAIDTSDFEDTPEGHARLRNKIEEYKKQKATEHTSSIKKKKPTKQELFKEQVAAFKSKTIRSIYIALVKLVHPDAEQDESIKKLKTTFMQRLTFAYENKDLPTLFQLETEWVGQNKEQASSPLLSSNLKMYNEILSERVQELEYKEYELKNNPKYYSLKDFLHLNEKRIAIEINKRAKSIKEFIEDQKKQINYLDAIQSKSEFSTYINFYYSTITSMDDVDF